MITKEEAIRMVILLMNNDPRFMYHNFSKDENLVFTHEPDGCWRCMSERVLNGEVVVFHR